MTKKKISNFKNFKLLLGIVNKINKGYIPLLLLNTLFKAFYSLLNIFVPMLFIKAYEESWQGNKLFLVFSILVFSKFFLDTIVKISGRELLIQDEKMFNEFPKEISKKAMELEYERLEDPEILDLKERAIFPITNYGSLYIFLSSLALGLTSFFTLVGSVGIILNFSLVLFLISIFLSALIIYIDKKITVYTQEISQEIIPFNRKYGYYSTLMADSTYQKEIRLYNMENLILKRAEEYIYKVLEKIHFMYKKQGNSNSLRALIQNILKVITYIYVALRVVSSRFGSQIGIGQFALLVGANESFMTSFQDGFSALFKIKMGLFHLQPFSEFMELDIKIEEENTGEDLVEEFESLEFKNVSFSYPASDKIILDDISFKINKGEKISIVGLNGSGKTTIVKLICRFFKPNSGKILLNGIDILNYNKEKYMENLSCVFQDFSLFPLSIKDNILANKEYEGEKLDRILEEVGIDKRIEELPSGIHTMLNKEIYDDATDFSGGEKQKIAIARALYRNSDLVILDEPTAALDPLAEAEVYENFNDLTYGKTAIFISHRMSSSTFCDKILLLDGGKVIAFDSHENLMLANNLYRDLFQTQAKYFNQN